VTYQPRRYQARSATATAAVVAALLTALVVGLRGGTLPRQAYAGGLLETFSVPPPPLPPPVEHRHIVRTPKPNGKAAPAGSRARPTDLVLPPPTLVAPSIVLPSSPVPGPGTADHAGVGDLRGTGQGTGGSGEGNGSGDDGTGNGSGGETAPVQRRGKLKMHDFPDAAGEITRDWIVGVRYLVGIDGRVSQCEITKASGMPALDAITCSLIQKRFRFDPSRDGAHRPVPAWVVETHGWGPERQPNDDADQ
jgi:protein TonB